MIGSMIRLLIEAFCVGILTVLFGLLISFSVGSFFSVDLPLICKKWNKNHVMEITLFLTGFTIHLFCEFTGINGWYCQRRNGKITTRE